MHQGQRNVLDLFETRSGIRNSRCQDIDSLVESWVNLNEAVSQSLMHQGQRNVLNLLEITSGLGSGCQSRVSGVDAKEKPNLVHRVNLNCMSGIGRWQQQLD